MGHRNVPLSAFALVLFAGIACGYAQLDMFSDMGLGSFGLRRLSAFYSRNFASHFPTTCYQSSYFSPFRLYFKSYVFDSIAKTTTFIYQLDVAACPYPKADCCRLWLDHMVVRTAANAKVLTVKLDGVVKQHDVGAQGLTIYRMAVEPTVLRSLQLEIVTPIDDYNYPSDLCPVSRFPGSCDVISYDESKTCCAERAALPYEMFFPSSLPPTSNAPASVASPPPPSPPPPPPSPPPPPPDGWDICCVDDLPKSPYSLKFIGAKPTGSDTAYLFSLTVRKSLLPVPDFDGPEPGDCSQMGLRDIGVAIYDNLLVKNVQFNGTLSSYWTEPQGSQPDAKWVYINLFKSFADFDETTPIDVVITVRGKVDALCPANEYLHSPNACEFAFHGKDNETQCCPHGATRLAGAYDECCVDDLDKQPYRLAFYNTVPTPNTTAYNFGLKVVNVTGLDYDLEEDAKCDHMTLDWAQIQIYKNVRVVSVRWDDRFLSFNTTPATDYSVWLNVYGINRFFSDFNPSALVPLTITVAGVVREMCPGGAIFDAGGVTLCEYALHGVQGNHTCCPHGLTDTGSPKSDDCGCRDDQAGTPYRLGYQVAAASPSATLFNFDVAKVDPAASADPDGAPDKNHGFDVDCSGMGLKSITFAVNKDLDVQDVIFNGFNYTWQFENYTSTAKWLRVLDLDYSPADFPAGSPVPLQILVKGAVSEMCPAASVYGSQASCEYFIYGLSGLDECCPAGLTTWFTPALAGNTRRR